MAYRSWTLLALLATTALAPACRRETAGLEGPALGRPDAASDAAFDAASDLPKSELGPVEPSDGPLESVDLSADQLPAETAAEASPPDPTKCAPGQTLCGAGVALYSCMNGTFGITEICPGACFDGKCVACLPDATRCTTPGTGTEVCKKDGSGFVAGMTCAEGCKAGVCNVCVPNASTCSGTTQKTCRPDGLGWVETTCMPPAGGGGTAGCNGPRCEVTCDAGRTKMGDRCVCAGSTVECGGACVPAVQVIEVPSFEKKCALPITDTCDPYEFPITIQACARQVEVTMRTEPEHCAPVFLQMLANGSPKGPRSAAIPPGSTSAPLNLGPLGPGPVTLGFKVTIDRTGCGVGGLVSSWGGSAKITLTSR